MRWLLTALLILPLAAQAGVLAYGKTDKGVEVSLTDGKCEMDLPPEIKSILNRSAVWQEKGKKFKGCWGYHPRDASYIVMAWEDDSHSVASRNEFKWNVSM